MKNNFTKKKGAGNGKRINAEWTGKGNIKNSTIIMENFIQKLKLSKK